MHPAATNTFDSVPHHVATMQYALFDDIFAAQQLGSLLEKRDIHAAVVPLNYSAWVNGEITRFGIRPDGTPTQALVIVNLDVDWDDKVDGDTILGALVDGVAGWDDPAAVPQTDTTGVRNAPGATLQDNAPTGENTASDPPTQTNASEWGNPDAADTWNNPNIAEDWPAATTQFNATEAREQTSNPPKQNDASERDAPDATDTWNLPNTTKEQQQGEGTSQPEDQRDIRLNDLMPPVGSAVRIWIPLKLISRPALNPNHAAAKSANELARHLQSQLRKIHKQHAQDLLEALKSVDGNQNPHGKFKEEEEYIKDQLEDQLTDDLAALALAHISTPHPEHSRPTDTMQCQHLDTSVALAQLLHISDGESQDDLLSRLKDLIVEWNLQSEDSKKDGNDRFECPGFRIQTPTDIGGSNLAVFRVNLPKEPDWDGKYQSPPARFEWPEYKEQPDLTTQILTWQKHGRTTIQIAWDIHDETAKQESIAINRMYETKINPLRQLLCRWLRDFDPQFVRPVNLEQQFPGFENLQFRSTEANRQKLALTHAPNGFLSIMGCPGSGKSTTADTLIIAALEHGARVMPRLQQSEWNRVRMDKKTQEDDEDEDPDEYDDMLDSEKESKRKIQVDFVKVGPEDWTLPAFEVGAIRPAKVLMVADSNELCDAMFNRMQNQIHERKLHRTIIRVYSWTAERDHIKDSDDSIGISQLHPEDYGDIQGTLLREEQELSTSRVRCRKHPFSLSNLVRRLMTENTSLRSAIETYRQARDTDYRLYKDSKRDFNRQVDEPMCDIINGADVVVMTPFALTSMARYMRNGKIRTKFDLLLVDEAGRCAESLVYIPLSIADDAAAIIVGDPAQFGPRSEAMQLFQNRTPLNLDHQGDFYTLFGPQRCTSLLQRLAATFNIGIELWYNWRCYGDIGAFAANKYTFGRMQLQKWEAPYTAVIIDHMRTLFNCQEITSNTLVLSINSSHSREGYSFVNSDHRNLGLLITRAIMAMGIPSAANRNERLTVMLLCPYNAQAAEYRKALRRMPDTVVYRDNIIANVDQSMSQEAGVVIYDTVRSTGVGFVEDQQRMFVATTRAQYFQHYSG